MPNLNRKNILFFFIFTALLSVCAVFIYLIFSNYPGGLIFFKKTAQQKKVAQEQISFTGLQEKKFSWSHDGNSYSISVNLYDSAYDYYRRQPKVYSYSAENIPPNWQEDYFRMFLAPAAGDQTFKLIAESLRNAGQAKSMSQDQLVDLALSFVQSIPYDDARASAILGSAQDNLDENTLPKYPYETLYENKGVCSDKSFLALLILKNLGYGGALLEYPEANHMAVGVVCPREYSTENSGFCYGETTTLGHRIGVIPQIDTKSRKALPKEEISFFSEEKFQPPEEMILSDPQILAKIEGAAYQGIIKTFAIQKEMAQIEKELYALRSGLTAMENEVDSMKVQLENLRSKMEKYKDDKNFDKYNDLVPKYNNLANDYEKKVKNYNSRVSEYNSKVKRYNQLIKEYSLTE